MNEDQIDSIEAVREAQIALEAMILAIQLNSKREVHKYHALVQRHMDQVNLCMFD